jgi:hypothetical protein
MPDISAAKKESITDDRNILGKRDTRQTGAEPKSFDTNVRQSSWQHKTRNIGAAYERVISNAGQGCGDYNVTRVAVLERPVANFV